MRARGAERLATAGVIAGASLLLLLLAIPIGSLVVRGGGAGLNALTVDAELRNALLLTAACATVATLTTILLGTPLAYLLARDSVPGGAALATLLELPLLIPHPVAGIALLLAFGRQTWIGGVLGRAGLGIVGSSTGITLAMLFVAAPLYMSAAREAIARVDRRYEDVARTLGDSR